MRFKTARRGSRVLTCHYYSQQAPKKHRQLQWSHNYVNIYVCERGILCGKKIARGFQINMNFDVYLKIIKYDKSN